VAVRDISWSSAKILENPGFSVAVRENPWRSEIILGTNYLGGIRGREAPVVSRSPFASRMDQVPPCSCQRYHFVGAHPGQPACSFSLRVGPPGYAVRGRWTLAGRPATGPPRLGGAGSGGVVYKLGTTGQEYQNRAPVVTGDSNPIAAARRARTTPAPEALSRSACQQGPPGVPFAIRSQLLIRTQVMRAIIIDTRAATRGRRDGQWR
jgi:hypothetical protein